MSETHSHRCTSEIVISGGAWIFRGARIEYCPLCGVHLDTLARLKFAAVLDELADKGLMTDLERELSNQTRVAKKPLKKAQP
jgi:hypothetical protein